MPALAATSYPDRLLEFKDTSVVASTKSSPAIFWTSNKTALVNAVPGDSGDSASRVDLIALDLRAGQATTVTEGATLLCWLPSEEYGVVQVSASGAFRRLVKTQFGPFQITDAPASRDECRSQQFFSKSQTLVRDLGKGVGVIAIEWQGGKKISETFVKEDGTRISLNFPGGGFGGNGTYQPWLEEFSVGKADGGILKMRKDGVVRLDSSGESVRQFFNEPGLHQTRAGYLVHTGVWDPYNGDTFFVPTGGRPFRIYKSKGASDQVGHDSVGPDGCVVVLSMAAAGASNRVLAYMNRAPQTLHFTDVCAAFPSN